MLNPCHHCAGSLPSSDVSAVQRLDASGMQGTREFMREVKVWPTVAGFPAPALLLSGMRTDVLWMESDFGAVLLSKYCQASGVCI